MSLVSHGSAICGEAEQDCADRWRLWHGLERAFCLAQVLRKTHPAPPMRVYYRTVANLLGEYQRRRLERTRSRR
jgi:hypothetical protein